MTEMITENTWNAGFKEKSLLTPALDNTPKDWKCIYTDT